jgi:ribosome biogenesis GTPase
VTAPGLIVARHRREAVIESAEGTIRRALVRGRKLRPVTGDEVRWHTESDGTAVIDGILPRRSLLERIDGRGRSEGVAANVTMLVIVIAPSPAPDWSLADRYLVATELLDVEAALIRNKADLIDPDIDNRCEVYRHIGYPVIATSNRPDTGIEALRELLSGHRSVLVGQSGTGKSSLLNALIGDQAQAVGALSERRELGRHTTTAAMLFRLPTGGELIDSPGVRRYAPHIPDLRDLAAGFREFRPWLGQCRFNDCRHHEDPGCTIRAALESGQISPERYQSFRQLAATLSEIDSR